MARKVIIDCDPGIDEAVALCLALFEPRLEVVAIAATEGRVSANTANRNVQTIIDQLDPPRHPRIGTAAPVDMPPDLDQYPWNGEDGLGNSDFAVAQLHHQHPSEKILCDEVRAAPDQVTVVSLGPLTNLARAFQRDPDLPALIDQVIISGGSLKGVGNVTPAAEFNMFYDPSSARTVFRSPITKTLIPLDVTEAIPFNLDFVDALPPPSTRAGGLLRKILPHLVRSYRQQIGQESIFLHDTVALTAALHPEMFEMIELDGDVETTGQLTKGATIFDRRQGARPLPNMAVAVEAHTAAVTDCILRGLAEAGRQT